MKQWEELQDPSKFHLAQEHDLFQILKKVNKQMIEQFPPISFESSAQSSKVKATGFLFVCLACLQAFYLSQKSLW